MNGLWVSPGLVGEGTGLGSVCVCVCVGLTETDKRELEKFGSFAETCPLQHKSLLCVLISAKHSRTCYSAAAMI